MKVWFSQPIDFNQMLVFSVFGHLLLLTVVLFLPMPDFSAKKVMVPAFMVNLVSEPRGVKSAAVQRLQPPVRVKKPRAKQSDKKGPAIKKTTASKLSEVKKVPTVKMPKSKGILETLNKLEGKAALTTLKVAEEELYQLAQLETPKHRPLPTKPLKKKPLDEEAFRELEDLKNKKVNEIKPVVPVPLREDILKDFEMSKMEESLPDTSVSLEKQQPVPKSKDLDKPKTPEKDSSKRFEKMAELNASPVFASGVETEQPRLAEGMGGSGNPYDSVKEKLGALPVGFKTTRVEISIVRPDSSTFQSELRGLKFSQATAESGVGDSHVSAMKEGTPGSDIQSLYAGRVKEEILKNWREPLAQEHNREVIVSFSIFRHGNIDKPFIKKSSGVEALDVLAVRAVLDSAPFPEFSQGLKASNLHLEMYFKYVPKDE